MREHGPVDAVSDGVDVGDDRLEARVDGHAAAVVLLDADLLQTEVVGVRPPTHAHCDAAMLT